VLLATVCARAFEDNNGALTLANSQRITSRTKYYHVEWHWFWSHVGKDVVILAVDTKLQLSDYLTKGLAREPFENNRARVQGYFAGSFFVAMLY
jgi:hypothetical protein